MIGFNNIFKHAVVSAICAFSTISVGCAYEVSGAETGEWSSEDGDVGGPTDDADSSADAACEWQASDGTCLGGDTVGTRLSEPPWPTVNGGAAQTRVSPFVGPKSVEKVWVTGLRRKGDGEDYVLGPIVGRENLYVVFEVRLRRDDVDTCRQDPEYGEGTLIAVSRETGDIRWSKTGVSFCEEPISTVEGGVMVNTSDGEVRNYDPAGMLRWSVAANVGHCRGGPMLDNNGAIYVAEQVAAPERECQYNDRKGPAFKYVLSKIETDGRRSPAVRGSEFEALPHAPSRWAFYDPDTVFVQSTAETDSHGVIRRLERGNSNGWTMNLNEVSLPPEATEYERKRIWASRLGVSDGAVYVTAPGIARETCEFLIRLDSSTGESRAPGFWGDEGCVTTEHHPFTVTGGGGGPVVIGQRFDALVQTDSELKSATYLFVSGEGRGLYRRGGIVSDRDGHVYVLESGKNRAGSAVGRDIRILGVGSGGKVLFRERVFPPGDNESHSTEIAGLGDRTIYLRERKPDGLTISAFRQQER